MRTPQWFTTVPVLMGGALAWPTLALPHAGKRVMDNKTSVTVFLLVASVFTACAGATKSDVPDTETQRKVRTDLEQCNVAAGNKAHGLTVSPAGKYSFQVTGVNIADGILACMTGKGYSAVRVDNTIDHGAAEMRRSGGEGQALR
jgi:hypothetical protein